MIYNLFYYVEIMFFKFFECLFFTFLITKSVEMKVLKFIRVWLVNILSKSRNHYLTTNAVIFTELDTMLFLTSQSASWFRRKIKLYKEFTGTKLKVDFLSKMLLHYQTKKKEISTRNI